MYRRVLLTVLTVGFIAGSAKADAINLQLGAGIDFTGPNPFDVINSTGVASLALTLDLGVPLTQVFYNVNYADNCVTGAACTFTSTTPLTFTTLNVTDSTAPSGTGTGAYTQNYTEVSLGAGTHTFTPLLSTPIVITLSNGKTLTITPLAGTPTAVTPAAGTGTQAVSATFLLGPVANVPEPTTFLLMGSALLLGLGFSLRKKSIS